MKFYLYVSVLAFLCDCGYGGWSFWSDWTTCPIPCEGRSKSRRRYCVTQFCNGHYFEFKDCEPKDCSVMKKISGARRQTENHNTTTLSSKVTKQQTIFIKTPSSVMLTSSIPRAPFRRTNVTIHPFIIVTVPALLHHTETVKNGERLQLTKKLTSLDHIVDNYPRKNNTTAGKQMLKPSSSKSKTANENNTNIVILVALPVLTICVVLYLAVKLFRMLKPSRSSNLESVDVSTSNKELSLSDYRDQDREEREYHYVSYDEISKRGSYENKSPSQSYVYDVTWF
ncbi:uncharacterized protein LOC128188436 [Crassostrea angulata]|uniref:uncharacterized protein LOC128188436 n=1 Tax=Magallana angulata TaxID=2784310 RepID=UPI0022B0B164|nr:uncharacterized protein LOC128188436 [Crassostrea angulata]